MKLRLFLTMAALQALDLVSSRMAFAAGAVELNPLIGTGSQPGALRLLMFKLACLAIFALYLRCMTRPWLAITACVVFGLVVFSNTLTAVLA